MHSLFGRGKEGGIERFDLVASIYVMDRGWRSYQPQEWLSTLGNDTEAGTNETEVDTGGGMRISSSRNGRGGSVSIHGGTGLAFQKKPEWERVWSEVVMRDLDVTTAAKKVVAKPVLPGKVM